MTAAPGLASKLPSHIDRTTRSREPQTKFTFVKVAIRVLEDAQLSPKAKLLYVMLCRFAHTTDRKSWPSRATLATLLGEPGQPASKRSVSRWIQELVDADYLAVTPRWRPAAGGQTSNMYVLLDAACTSNRPKKPELPASGGWEDFVLTSKRLSDPPF